MNKKFFLAAAIVFITWGVHLLVRDYQQRAMEEADPTYWNESSARRRVEGFEEKLAAVRAALGKGDTDGAVRAFREAQSELGELPMHHGARELAPGVTLGARCTAAFESLRVPAEAQLDALAAKYAAGQESWDKLQEFATAFSTAPLALDARLRTREDAIETLRARNAATWLEVEVSGPPRYRELVMKTLLQRWNGKTGYRIVFGSGHADRSRRAAWKRLGVSVEENKTGYSRTGLHMANRPEAFLPDSVVVNFRIDHDLAKVPTSWDKLPQLRVTEDAPNSISVESGRGEGASLKHWEESMRTKLVEKLAAKLGDLPEFSLFPGMDATKLKLVGASGLVDRTAAVALAHLDRERFNREWTEARARRSTVTDGALALLSVQMRWETEIPWVCQSLVSADSATQRDAATLLRANPAYGNYQPLLALLARTQDRGVRNDLLAALKGQFVSNAAVKASMIELLKGREERRAEIVEPFLAEVPPAELPAYAAWLLDSDTQFADKVFETMLRRDRAVAEGLLLRALDAAPPQTLAMLIPNLRVNDKTDTALVDRLARMVDDTRMPEAPRMAALNALLGGVNLPALHAALSRVNPQALDANHRRQLERRLVDSARQALGDGADAYLLQRLSKALESDYAAYAERVRTQGRRELGQAQGIGLDIMEALFASDVPKDAGITAVYQYLRGRPDDRPASAAAVTAILQSIRHRRNWNYAQPELLQIVRTGMTHPAINVRSYAYEIASLVAAKGIPGWNEALNEGLNAEPDANTKQRWTKKTGQAQ